MNPLADDTPAVEASPASDGRGWPMILWTAVGILIGLYAAMPVMRHAWFQSGNVDQARISLNFRLIAQYAIGSQLLQRMSPQTSATLNEQLMDKVEANAETEADRLFLSVISGELFDREQALARLAEYDPPASSRTLQSDAAILETLYREGPRQLAPPEAKQLRRKYRWFGELALASGQAADDPIRQAAKQQAYLVFGMLLAIMLGLLFGGAAGIALLVIAGAANHIGKLHRGYRQTAGELQESGAPYLEVFFLLLAMLLFTGLLGALANVSWLWLLQPALLLLVFWLPVRNVPWKQARIALGLHSGKGILRELGSGAVGYLAGIPILIVGILVSAKIPRLIDATGLTPYLPNKADHPAMEQLAHGSTLDVIGLFFMACVVAPILEETFFRGALYHYLRRHHRFFVAALISGFLFAAVHPQSVVGIPALTAIGVMLAMIREWRGSLLAPMLAHAIHNGIVMTFGLLVNR